ncbi:MAG TPA: two-component regulator propeller domain-containing protein [Bacteroidales bacterium]|nr:two-component regulator propeller domain-containing protein [Bacteroidales bacterium]
MSELNNIKLCGNNALRRSFWILLFSIVVIFQLNAQPQNFKFDHLTIDDGLSSNRIRSIFRDNKDYLWIGTDVGLDRYDSYQIKKYRYGKNQPGTISSDILTCIYEDKEKNLWFGTYEGLNLYNPSGDNFKVFKRDPTDKNSINSNCITGIVEDKKGNLWIVSDGSCLNRWDPMNQNFIRYPFEEQRYGLSVRPSRMAATDSKGYIWVASLSPGITRFDPESGLFTKYDDPAIDFGNSSYKSIYIDNQDKIWIATDGIGFFSYDPITNKFEHFGVKSDGKGTNLNFVLDIIPEGDRYLLLAVDQGGINRFDKVSKSFEYIMYNSTNSDGLNNNGILCFHRDIDSILWVGTSGGGINYYNPKKDRFKLFTHNSDNPNSLSYNFTSNFYEDHQGLIWIGTDGGGINVYDPKTGKFEVFKHEKDNPFSISGNVIRGIAEDKDHDIWIGTWDAGLNRYDRKTGRFYHYLPDSKDPSSISDKTIWGLFIDHNNILWLSVYNTGIDLFDTKKGVTRRFRNDPDDPSSISGKNSWFFFEDNDKKMWICTQNGLSLYDSSTFSFKVYNKFPDNDIGALYIDKAGYLWVGSNTKGLFKCNKSGIILTTYDISHGLPNNRIHAITQDNEGKIWISSNYGISRLNTEIQMIRNYSKEDGLQGDQFYQQSFLKTREGELYFGGYNGFNSFFPDRLKDNDSIPPVYFADFQIFNKPVEYSVPGSQFQTHISEAKEIALKWNQSVFSLSFVAINYTYPKKNQYAYRMEGFEKEWNYTDASRRYVTYTNLDPGEYTFRVRATNNDAIWNDEGASLKIIILPPWWRTLWFRVILIIIIVILLVSFFLSRVRQLNNQKILLEKLVKIKTSELNEINASKDKFFSIIAHDLKNPFNSIIGLSEVMNDEIKSNNFAQIKEYSEMINTSAVETYRLLENLLEWANSQRGKTLFNPVQINLRVLYDEEFRILNDMAIRKNIELKCTFPDTLIIIADKNMIKTILRNLITNAIKFTHKNGKVEVKAFIENDQVEVSVSDSGIGMKEETMAKLFRIDANLTTRGTENENGTGLGLFLCKEFIEKHGGKIWVESESGKGSIFKFNLPLDIKPSI